MIKSWALLRKRFASSDDGATAVEFALIMPPFFLMIFAILETASIFFVSTTLENAVLDAGRQIRTGQAQSAEMTASQFRDEICARIDMFMSCDNQSLVLDVERFSSFTDLEFPNAMDGNGNLNIDAGFDTGNPGDIVLIRVYYMWDVMTPVVGRVMANTADHETRLIVATAVFRNEPFGSILGAD